MANLVSIARPYALAAFEVAREKEQLLEWKSFLESAALVANDKACAKFLDNPYVTAEDLLTLFTSVLDSLLSAERKNFLAIVAENKRLAALPDIAILFNANLAALQKMSDVRVTTAIEAKEDFKQKLAQALTKRIKHAVTLHCDVDPTILGGAIIHMGDRVIDGSVRGKLNRLQDILTS